jgi:hypothetical protein
VDKEGRAGFGDERQARGAGSALIARVATERLISNQASETPASYDAAKPDMPDGLACRR